MCHTEQRETRSSADGQAAEPRHRDSPARGKRSPARRGATAIEYALIASLVSVIAIGAIQEIGATTQGLFNKVSWTLGDNAGEDGAGGSGTGGNPNSGSNAGGESNSGGGTGGSGTGSGSAASGGNGAGNGGGNGAGNGGGNGAGSGGGNGRGGGGGNGRGGGRGR
jgi:Flp pilus assembly pilin Flp